MPKSVARDAKTSRPVAFRAADLPAALLALVVEGGIAMALALGSVGTLVAVIVHGLVIGGLLARMVQQARRGADIGPSLLAIPAIAFTGVFGALGSVIIGWLSQRHIEDVERLEAWYRRISFSTELNPTARLADHVVTGRALDFNLQPVSPMSEMIQRGSIGEKQAILGLVARRFHPDYLPTLQIALVSDEPVIRVQAAAVAAKIRGDMPAMVDALLRDAADGAADMRLTIQRLREAELCARSGLMEAKDQERMGRLIDGLMSRTMLRLERNGPLKSALAPDVVIDAFDEHLLATRRHGDFRRARKQRKWARRVPWQWRPMARTSSRANRADAKS